LFEKYKTALFCIEAVINFRELWDDQRFDFQFNAPYQELFDAGAELLLFVRLLPFCSGPTIWIIFLYLRFPA